MDKGCKLEILLVWSSSSNKLAEFIYPLPWIDLMSHFDKLRSLRLLNSTLKRLLLCQKSSKSILRLRIFSHVFSFSWTWNSWLFIMYSFWPVLVTQENFVMTFYKTRKLLPCLYFFSIIYLVSIWIYAARLLRS